MSLGWLVPTWARPTQINIDLGRLGLTRAKIDLAQHGPNAYLTLSKLWPTQVDFGLGWLDLTFVWTDLVDFGLDQLDLGLDQLDSSKSNPKFNLDNLNMYWIYTNHIQLNEFRIKI